jgi:hypothetical protein
MQEDPNHPQARRVRAQVERIGTYMHEPRLRARYKGLENYHSRLPSILTMSMRGLSPDEVAAYYGTPTITTYGVTRSLQIVSEHIAKRLNQGL